MKPVVAAYVANEPLGFAVGMPVGPATERNFIRAGLVDPRHPGSAIQPRTAPTFSAAQFTFRMSSTSGNKSREDFAARALTDRVVPEVEAPPNLVAHVG